MQEVIYKTFEVLEQFAECKGNYINAEEKKEILKLLKKKEYHNEERLRVVLVGRTNAGKSTLTNALLQKEITYVSKRESTSWNTSFWPSESEYCIGTTIDDDLDTVSKKYRCIL